MDRVTMAKGKVEVFVRLFALLDWFLHTWSILVEAQVYRCRRYQHWSRICRKP